MFHQGIHHGYVNQPEFHWQPIIAEKISQRIVIELVGKYFESSCEGLPALQASSWYQHVHGIYEL